MAEKVLIETFLLPQLIMYVLSLNCIMNNNIVDYVKIVLLLQGISKIQMTCWSFWSEMKKISQHVESASNFPTRQSHVWKIILKQFIFLIFLCILALTAIRSSIPRSLCTITQGDLVCLNKLNKYLVIDVIITVLHICCHRPPPERADWVSDGEPGWWPVEMCGLWSYEKEGWH